MPMTSLQKDNSGRTRARTLVLSVLWLALMVGLVFDARAAVDLVSFEATPQVDGWILVTWETETELNTVAFNLYRSESAGGHGDQPVKSLPARGDRVTGAEYSYEDTDVTPNVRYYYYLVEMIQAGPGQRFGPVNAGIGLQPEPTATPTATATAVVTPSPTATVLTGVQATWTATPTQVTSRDRPTATRAFTNTPRPEAPATPTAIPAVAQPAFATPTPLSPAQIVTPTGGPPQPFLSMLPAPSATPLRSVPVIEAAPSPTRRVEATSAPTEAVPPTPQVTQPPRVFEPVASAPSAAGTSQRPAVQTAVPPADEAERDTRLVLFLGGAAIGMAVLFGVAAVLIWRSRPR